jgi:pimeloyl-ACP methyl ester carboxylesterase
LRRHFLRHGDRQLHLRWAGDGPPVVLLHPSPLSSTAVLPVATALARHCRVYALDTPGYGLSDAPARQPASLDDYLPDLSGALDALGLDRVCLYGCATGAQIAIEYARRQPERVALLVLDTAGHIPADECERIVRDYFPSVRPEKDGRHLATLWHMVRDLFVFFPWCDTRGASRVLRDLPPPEVMQSMLLDYLRAGERYDWAYRPAFHNEHAERARAVTVPTILTRWAGSIALRITDALIDSGLPQNFTVLPLGPSMADRCDGIAAAVRQRLRLPDAPTLPASTDPPGRLASRYFEARGGQLHARASAPGSGRPVLVLHSPAASAALVEPIAAPWVGSRPVIALDLPGNGESDALLADADLSIENYAAVVNEALDAAGIDEVDVAGRYMGGDVGVEISRQRPSRVRHLAFLGVPLFEEAEREEMLRRYCPSVAPRPDGTHLLAAWYMMRDQALWFPYYRTRREAILPGDPSLDPQFIHRRVVELMKMGDRYRHAYAAEFRYPLAQRLGQATAHVTLASAAWEALGTRVGPAQRCAPAARTLTLPDRFEDWATALERHWGHWS